MLESLNETPSPQNSLPDQDPADPPTQAFSSPFPAQCVHQGPDVPREKADHRTWLCSILPHLLCGSA